MNKSILTLISLFFIVSNLQSQKLIDSGIKKKKYYEPQDIIQLSDQSILCDFRTYEKNNKYYKINSDGDKIESLELPKDFYVTALSLEHSAYNANKKSAIKAGNSKVYRYGFYNGEISIYETSPDFNQVKYKTKDKRIFNTTLSESYLNEKGNPTWVLIGVDPNTHFVRQMNIDIDIQKQVINVNEFVIESLGKFEKNSGIVYIGRKNNSSHYAIAKNLRANGNYNIKIISLNAGKAEILEEFDDKIEKGFSYKISSIPDVSGNEEKLKFYIATTPDITGDIYKMGYRNLGFKIYEKHEDEWQSNEFVMPNGMQTNDTLSLDLNYSSIKGEEYYFTSSYLFKTKEGKDLTAACIFQVNNEEINYKVVTNINRAGIPAFFPVFDEEHVTKNVGRQNTYFFELEDTYRILKLYFELPEKETLFFEVIDIPKL